MAPRLTSTRGIVFSQVKYSDTSLIVKIFTEEFGLRSYLVKGARNPRAKIRAALFQPLTILDLVVSGKESQNLHHIREARVAVNYRSIPVNIQKTSILVFLDELLYKSVKEEEPNRELFAFLVTMLKMLDDLKEGLPHIHLYFLVCLTRFLGFYPHGRYSGPSSHFSLADGRFSEGPCLPGPDILEGPACHYLDQLLGIPPEGIAKITASSATRIEFLEKMLWYYRYHLSIPGEFKSHTVLHEIFRE